MPQTTLPDCAWCSAADTLSEIIGAEVRLFECSYCLKLTRVDEKNRAHRMEPRQTDVSGNQMYE